jgi:hypothetical protein
VRAAISEMLHGSDQLPLGPHANRVLVHRLVDDLERHKRGQFETLQADADLGGALSDHADVRRGGDDFVDTARALCATVVSVPKRQPGDRWKWVFVKLKKGGRVRNEIKTVQASHKEVPEIWQLAQLGRQPFELVVVDLEHTLEVRSRSTQFEFRTESCSSCRSWPISAGSDVSWLPPTWKHVTQGQIKIHLPRVPHVKLLEIGQQTELGGKRRQLVAVDLKHHGFWSDHDPIASTIAQ